MPIHGTSRLAEDRGIQNCVFHFQLKTFLSRRDLGLKNIADILQGLRSEDFVIKGHGKEMIEKTEERVILSLDDEFLPVDNKSATVSGIHRDEDETYSRGRLSSPFV